MTLFYVCITCYWLNWHIGRPPPALDPRGIL